MHCHCNMIAIAAHCKSSIHFLLEHILHRQVMRHPSCSLMLHLNMSCVMQVISKAADAFSAGDIVNRRVRQFQSWSLMPFAAVVGSVFPAAYMRGSRETFGLFPGEMNFPRCADTCLTWL